MTECGYCSTTEMVYPLSVRGGQKYRCIECLAIEQGQQQLSLPFDAWLDRDDIEPPAGDDTPDFEAFDPRKNDYESAQAWLRILARLKDDDPIVKPDAGAIGTINEGTREFLMNVMGEDAHKKPSELKA